MQHALINCAIVSLRKEAEETSELIDEDLYGSKVELLEEGLPGWYKIRTHYGYTGYVKDTKLLLDENKIALWDVRKKMSVLRSFADVLSLPKVQGHCFISLTRGAVIAILGDADDEGWVRVGLCDGREGYMKESSLGEYITQWLPADESRLRKNIVETALSYLGTQYRWGGRSPKGIDCSGLCSISYQLNGVIIYRDADIAEGFPVHRIPEDRIKPCDLLFFPGHVAMYIGSGKYVHSTGKKGSDGVVVNSLKPEDEDYREDLREKITAVGSIF